MTTTNSVGCDSIVSLHLSLFSCSTTEVDACDSYLWHGRTYTNSGTYRDGNDTLVLTIHRSSTGDTLANACGGFSWYEHNLVASQDVSHTFIGANAAGCDSIVTLHFRLKNCNVTEVTACNSYTWHGFPFTSSGVYADGDDTLRLTINRSSTGDTLALASGSFDWYEHLGLSYTQSVSHTFHGANVNGCDSIVTLHLLITNAFSKSVTIDTVTACDSYSWHGFTFTNGGYYSLGTAALLLTIHHSSTSDTIASACNSYDWYEYANITSTQNIAHTFYGGNAEGCDSVLTLHLTINNCATTEVAACDSYSWHGYTFTSNGTFYDGYDTIILSINHSTSGDTTAVVCGNFDWYEHNNLTSSQYVNHTFHGANIMGCDSIATLHLTVNNCSTTDAVACESFAWHGFNITSSGVYNDGYDTLRLTINHATSSDISAEACGSYIWAGAPTSSWAYDSLLTVTGVYPLTITNSVGCDSVATLHLTINQCSTTEVVACDSYLWNGNNYYNSGIYNVGHDTLILSVNHASTGDTVASACDSFSWYGATYSSSTSTPVHVYTNAQGCDSVVTLHLTINHCSTVNVDACDSYLWNGVTYNTSGTYTNGTDTLVLNIKHSSSSNEVVTACDSYSWAGAAGAPTSSWAYDSLLTTSGVYTLTTTNSVGCDSIATLNLTVNYSTTSEESLSVCDSYSWAGAPTSSWAYDSLLTTSGVYVLNLTNSVGCDSIATLNLTVNYSTTSEESQSACDSYTWAGAPTSSWAYDSLLTTSGVYVLNLTNAAGCDSVATLNLTINYSAETTVEETATASYEWNGNTYTESGTYTWTGTTEAGCDSIVTLILTINPIGIDGVTAVVNVSIYPNPTRGMVNIDADDEVLKVEVYDLNGRKVATHDNTNRIDLHGLSTGSYTLRIYTQRATAIKRVILK